MSGDFSKRDIPNKSDDISAWYGSIVLQAGLVEYSDVKGSLILRPRSYALWEALQNVLDPWFKDYGVENAYFPLLIPLSLIEQEKKHLEGFSPELAVVTHAGGEELSEPYAIRPTSETVITKAFSKWLSSYRDLPIKLNQWCNVVRWEKRTYPFIRTSEFLWQEGHTIHISKEDAMQMVLKALDWYRKFYEEYAALSPYIGIKSESERFAGACETYTVELVMPNGKALQGATSHYLGDNFTKVFNVEYLNENGAKAHPLQTSWGISTRYIGGLVLSHGDDAGLIIPPRIAPVQVIIIPVFGKDGFNQKETADAVKRIERELRGAGVRVKTDGRSHQSLGFRINDAELAGVPLRIELGAKELAAGEVTFASRVDFVKSKADINSLIDTVPKMLEQIQSQLFDRSTKMKESLTMDIGTWQEFVDVMTNQRIFARVLWCEESACEANIKVATKAVSRVLEIDRIDKREEGKCFKCGHEASRRWLFAQSY